MSIGQPSAAGTGTCREGERGWVAEIGGRTSLAAIFLVRLEGWTIILALGEEDLSRGQRLNKPGYFVPFCAYFSPLQPSSENKIDGCQRHLQRSSLSRPIHSHQNHNSQTCVSSASFRVCKTRRSPQNSLSATISNCRGCEGRTRLHRNKHCGKYPTPRKKEEDCMAADHSRPRLQGPLC